MPALWSRFRHLTSADGLRGQIFRGGIWGVGTHALAQILGLAQGILLARVLGANDYGVYAFAMAVLGLLTLPAAMGTPALLTRELAARQARADWAGLRGTLAFALAVVLVVSAALTLLGAAGIWAGETPFKPEKDRTLLLMLAALPASALLFALAGALRGLRHVALANVVQQILRPSVMVAAVSTAFALVAAWRTPSTAMAVQAGGALAAALVAAVLVWRCLPQSARHGPVNIEARYLLAAMLPLVLSNASTVVMNQTDVILLSTLGTDTETGLYRVAVQGSNFVSFGLVAANRVVAPYFSRFYGTGDTDRLQRLLTLSARATAAASLPLALAFILAGGSLASWVFGAEFAGSHAPLAILAVGQLINASVGSVGMVLDMAGHERTVARTLLSAALANVVLNLVLIPPFGMVGAALATASSIASWNVAMAVHVRRKLGLTPTPFPQRRAKPGAAR